MAKESGVTSKETNGAMALTRHSGYLRSSAHGSIGGYLMDEAFEDVPTEREMK